MGESTKPISPLRQRMIEDMRLRKLNPKTQRNYVRVVKEFARFLRRPPDTADAEDLRRYQLHLVEQGTSTPTLNATITGLKFFFNVTLDRPEAMKRMHHVYEPRRLPEILSPAEVTRLLQSAGGLKYQAALGVAYGAGLRASEVVHLKVSDIDSERKVIRVDQGKGKRDRYAMLSPALLQLLRAWWREGRTKRPTPRGLVVSGAGSGEPVIDPATQSDLSPGAHRRGD
jgi:site-specific recombinase XerD